ncbi:MAG: hypothetical protein R2759_15740 [Bacteroidales bacterium]
MAHTRVYRTDRLGMPLIETVTYPDCVNPDEVQEACDYIRFLNRSTGLVRTGMGAGRQDVNVSCRGGSRVEIKGVAHTKWIPELTHNESFRQWALLAIRDELNKRFKDTGKWKMAHVELKGKNIPDHERFLNGNLKDQKLIAVNLPGFGGLMSHFTQPGKMFADEIKDRLKVIACLIPPFMMHSEELQASMEQTEWDNIAKKLNAGDQDAQLLFWGPEDDIKTALETIEERCRMAFEGVPNETRKSFADGTTIFERVLPGADRMYPDTDTAPLPLANDYIEKLSEELPTEVIDRYHQLIKWNIPENTYTYIFSKNHFPLIHRLIEDLDMDPVFAGTFIGHTFKFIEGHYNRAAEFDTKMISGMFKYLKEKGIGFEIGKYMLPEVFEHPKMDFDSVLESLPFKKIAEADILSMIPFLKNKFAETAINHTPENEKNWIMGELRKKAVGNIALNKLAASFNS